MHQLTYILPSLRDILYLISLKIAKDGGRQNRGNPAHMTPHSTRLQGEYKPLWWRKLHVLDYGVSLFQLAFHGCSLLDVIVDWVALWCQCVFIAYSCFAISIYDFSLLKIIGQRGFSFPQGWIWTYADAALHVITWMPFQNEGRERMIGSVMLAKVLSLQRKGWWFPQVNE